MAPLFNNQFYEEVEEKINQIINLFKLNWIWGVVLLLILIGFIFIQQIILTFLGSYL